MIKHKELINLYIKDKDLFNRLFKDCLLFNTFKGRMLKECKNYKKYSYTDKEGSDKMSGDIFEIFSEIFFNILGADNRVGVCDYKPEQVDDCGVDASGLGINGQKITIQCKFRADESSELTQADLNQFAFQSNDRFDVNTKEKGNMILFTSSKGMHWFTSGKVFNDKIRVINYDNLRTLVDNNYPFWKKVIDMVEETIKNKFV